MRVLFIFIGIFLFYAVGIYVTRKYNIPPPPTQEQINEALGLEKNMKKHSSEYD